MNDNEPIERLADAIEEQNRILTDIARSVNDVAAGVYYQGDRKAETEIERVHWDNDYPHRFRRL